MLVYFTVYYLLFLFSQLIKLRSYFRQTTQRFEDKTIRLIKMTETGIQKVHFFYLILKNKKKNISKYFHCWFCLQKLN